MGIYSCMSVKTHFFLNKNIKTFFALDLTAVDESQSAETGQSKVCAVTKSAVSLELHLLKLTQRL
jgi:hypothetical protein